MALMDLGIVDFISIDPKGNVVLTIADELPWEGNDHLLALRNKVNAYMRFIEDESLYQVYPNARNRNIVINIMAKYEANIEGRTFLENLKNSIETAGYGFLFCVQP
jgi:hypothetical protein